MSPIKKKTNKNLTIAGSSALIHQTTAIVRTWIPLITVIAK